MMGRLRRSDPVRWVVPALAVLLMVVMLLAWGGARPLTAPAATTASPSIAPAAGGSNTVIATIPINSGAAEGTFDPANGDLYIPTGVGIDSDGNTSNVTVISGATNTVVGQIFQGFTAAAQTPTYVPSNSEVYVADQNDTLYEDNVTAYSGTDTCLLYTSPSPRDPKTSRMPSSA